MAKNTVERVLITEWFRRIGPAVLLLSAILRGPASAQPVDFGTADDPREKLQVVWWRFDSNLDLMGGLSLISNDWRSAGSASVNVVRRQMTARLRGTFRAGVGGEYRPDIDEAYDLVRLVEFVRYQPPPQSRLYVRAGLIDRMRLGTGHVVNFFNSSVAWDERTVGAEAMYGGRLLDLAAFSDNVLVDGVVGGRAAVRPMGAAVDPRLRSVEIGVARVSDLATRHLERALTAYDVDISFDMLGSGDLRLVPFASYAWYPDYGSGLSVGADLESDNFIDLARFRLRLALYYNGREFIPGYVGSFYRVSNAQARILNADRFHGSRPAVEFEGLALENALGGNDLESELRVLIFDRFELWHYFRRHYGSHSLSEYHLRVYFIQPNRLTLDVGIDRGGLRGLFSLFNDLGDQTALVFGTEFRVRGPIWAHIRSRYTFALEQEDESGTQYYLVQRRFEPFTGLRLTF